MTELSPQPEWIAPQGELPPPPPAPPRAVTREISRRAWKAHAVRVWWMLALALLVITGYYVVSRWYVWSQEKWLIEKGTKVQAEVMGIVPNEEAPRNLVIPLHYSVDLRYDFNGQKYLVRGLLEGRKESVLSRSMIPLFIDPKSPTRWTARVEPAELTTALLAPALLVPGIVLLAVVAVWRWRKVLRIYRDGPAIAAQVLEIRSTAAAPRSRLLRCAVRVGKETRVVRVIVPARLGPRDGQVIWLIAPVDKPEQALPAELFQ